ncbi:MAG: putative sulfate exporter family transporter [Deltaproteobacteria bacterium]|nr:putative sulfate exporter family transporter [Deltaproteobacteria bacterium]MBW2413255.1 putative sulfate exporter family transporter [Deltaproteobacteria bacterium]
MPQVVVGTRSGDPYKNPELFRFVGSMEGVPEWADPAETQDERAARRPWQRRANHVFELIGTTMPGVVLAAALALLSGWAAEAIGVDVLGFERTPLSPILVAILLGVLVRNSLGLPAVYEAGLQLCLKRILRVGVALLGIRLSLGAAGAIGLVAVPIVIGCITAALLLVSWINRALGLPRRLGTLIAVGTAICGNTAIVATAPVIGAKDDEVSYAVGCITVFGLIALMGYPFLSHWLFAGDPTLAGLFLGTAIHDTAQVAGAGLVYVQQFGAPAALDTATVTKLVRNLFMLGVIPLVAVMYHRGDPEGPRRLIRPRFSQAVPLFVFGFVAMTAVRSVGDLGDSAFGVLSHETWKAGISGTGRLASLCLIVAMASVGLGTSFSRLRTLGLKPLAVGLCAALLVGGVSFALVSVVGPLSRSMGF